MGAFWRRFPSLLLGSGQTGRCLVKVSAASFTCCGRLSFLRRSLAQAMTDDRDNDEEVPPENPFTPIDQALEEMFSNHVRPPSEKRESYSSFHLTGWTKD